MSAEDLWFVLPALELRDSALIAEWLDARGQVLVGAAR